MSIHVCKCVHNGVTEFHLRYPGMTEKEAQELADKINSGAILPASPPKEIRITTGDMFGGSGYCGRDRNGNLTK